MTVDCLVHQSLDECAEIFRDHGHPELSHFSGAAPTRLAIQPSYRTSVRGPSQPLNAYLMKPRHGWLYPFLTAILAITLLSGSTCGESAGAPQSTASTQPDATTTDTPPVAKPFKTITLKGNGSRLTGQFELPEGDYKVSWKIHLAPGGYCCPNLIADMIGVDKTNLVASSDPSGSTLFSSGGGFFRIKTDASDTTWVIIIEQI